MNLRRRINVAAERFKRKPLDTKTNISNFALAAMLAVFTVKSSCSDDKMKGQMLTLAKTDTGLIAKLVNLQEQQNKTALDITNFNRLLIKTDAILDAQSKLVSRSDEQVGKLKDLNSELTKEVDILRNVYLSNQKELYLKRIGELKHKFDLYTHAMEISNSIRAQALTLENFKWQVAQSMAKNIEPVILSINEIQKQIEKMPPQTEIFNNGDVEIGWSNYKARLSSLYYVFSTAEHVKSPALDIHYYSDSLWNSNFESLLQNTYTVTDTLNSYFAKQMDSVRRLGGQK